MPEADIMAAVVKAGKGKAVRDGHKDVYAQKISGMARRRHSWRNYRSK